MNTDISEIIIKKYKISNDYMFSIALTNFVDCADAIIAKECGMDEYDYQILMQRKFNGSMWNQEVWFLDLKDAIDAKDYLQAVVLANSLANVPKENF